MFEIDFNPKKKFKPLTKTELQQLMSYCYWAQGSGDYYGNEAQFRKRHDNIVAWIDDCIEKLEG
jgi:hypothetical protein